MSAALVPVIVQTADVSPTVVVAAAELLAVEGSVVEEDTFAVLVMTVPFGVPGFTFTTSVNEALASSATLGLVQLTVPVPPTDGVEQVQPAAAVKGFDARRSGHPDLPVQLPTAPVATERTAWMIFW